MLTSGSSNPPFLSYLSSNANKSSTRCLTSLVKSSFSSSITSTKNPTPGGFPKLNMLFTMYFLLGVCREWYELFLPKVYYSLELHAEENQLYLLGRSLQENPRLGACISPKWRPSIIYNTLITQKHSLQVLYIGFSGWHTMAHSSYFIVPDSRARWLGSLQHFFTEKN